MVGFMRERLPQEEAELRNAAFAEAESFALPPDWMQGREQIAGIAIDNPTTRDRDDAIGLVRHEDGSYTAEISIADVGSFMHALPHTIAYAQRRGETRYLRTSNIPMIPPAISEGVLSLNAGQARPAFTSRIHVTPDGTAGQAAFAHTAISASNTSYYNVNRLAEGKGSESEIDLVHTYGAFAEILLEARRRNGALAVYLPEKGIMTGLSEDLIAFKPGESRIGQLIVQEFMILNNIAMAEYAAHYNIPIINRNHSIRTDAPPKLLQRLLAQEDLERSTLGQVYERARYGSALIGHAALNLAGYAHSTSPLRRFADIVTQANVRAHLLGQESTFSRDEITMICTHLNIVQDEIRDEMNFRSQQIAGRLRGSSGASTGGTPSPAALKMQIAEAGGMAPQFHEAATSGELSVSGQQLLTKKLEERTFDATDLDGLFEAAEKLVLSPEHAAQLTAYLTEHPHIAFTALHQAAAKGFVHNLSAKAKAQGAEFTGVVQCTLPSGQLMRLEVTLPRKKDALHMGSVALVAKLIGTTEQLNIAPNPVSPEAPQNMTFDNAKNKLQEHFQKRGDALPQYETRQIGGPSNKPVFECSVQIVIAGEPVTITATGNSKKNAEMAAADQAFTLVAETVPQQTPNAPQALEVPEGKTPLEVIRAAFPSPINTLQEYQQAHSLAVPHYSITTNPGGVFTALVSVAMADGTTEKFEASGSNKKTARADAAAQALLSGKFGIIIAN